MVDEAQAAAERAAMVERYEARQQNIARNSADTLFGHFASAEREAHQLRFLRAHFGDSLASKKMLEVGAGAGNNLYFYLRQGFAWNQLYANELLPERVQRLLEVHPISQNIFKGDLLELEPAWDGQFDIVFQSVVFSSVLQPAVRQMLAHKMTELLAPNGVILWYDFTVDNPKNIDVRGVKRREVEGYFPGFVWEWEKVTLLPPLARKVGVHYPLVNSVLPMLRTHILGIGKRV